MKTKKANGLTNLYLFTIFQSLQFFVPILMAFYKYNNLSFFQIMFMQSMYSVINVIFSIVAGAIADIKGERFALVISTVLNASGYALGFWSHHLWQFILFNIFIALGNSFFAGIYRAFVYTTLVSKKREKESAKVFSSLNRISLLAGAVIWPFCFFVAKAGRMKYMLLLTAVSYGISMIPLIRSKLATSEKAISKFNVKNYFNPIKETVKLIKKDEKLRAIFIDVVFFEIATLTVLEFSQPLLKVAGLNLKYVGFFFSVAALAPFFVLGKFEGFLKLFKKKSIFVLMSKILTLLSFAILLFNNVPSALVAITVIATFNKIRIPFFNVIVNDTIEGKCRSTVFSVMTGIEMLVFVFLKPLMGLLADLNVKYILVFPMILVSIALIKRGEKLIF